MIGARSGMGMGGMGGRVFFLKLGRIGGQVWSRREGGVQVAVAVGDAGLHVAADGRMFEFFGMFGTVRFLTLKLHPYRARPRI